MAYDNGIPTEVEPKASSATPSAAPSGAETIHPRKDSNSHTSIRSEKDVTRGERNQRESGRGRDNGRGKGRRGGQGGRQKTDMGRKEWSRNRVDKRKRHQDEQAAKRQKLEFEGVDAVPARFTKEEIEAEVRKPKCKVAVLIGYAGSGYKGMQINKSEKTIEGDIFSAFVSAGAISKANADDPKKSSLVRCARTDKGVHAAGNVISLKLIVVDPDIVQKINDALPPQIRVWGFVKTTSSFSCYQLCDSRWYEYLIPTSSFLPPHPQSFLGKELVESAKRETAYERLQALQEDVTDFWEEAEKTYVNPILDKLDPVIRKAVMKAIHAVDSGLENLDLDRKTVTGDLVGPSSNLEYKLPGPIDGHAAGKFIDNITDGGENSEGSCTMAEATVDAAPGSGDNPNKTIKKGRESATEQLPESPEGALEAAIKDVKAAYIKAKKVYRISAVRRQRVQEALSTFVGTQNFHNYTILKDFKDPSAQRVIRSFKVGNDPLIINDTEWLSLKIHGQSFMMHQIRKMVAMVAMVVRCGCPVIRINESYGSDKISIPKAPGLGLLLERPVFDTYNNGSAREFQREKIDFDIFNKEIEEFKIKEIYERIFREEEKDHHFHNFFNYVDHYQANAFLWATSTGVSAAMQHSAKGERVSRGSVNVDVRDSEDEGSVGNGDG